MVQFRPHTLRYSVVTAGYDDEDGNYVAGGSSLSESISCRYEPNGSANSIALPNSNGEVYTYSYIVYLDVTCRDFSYGDIIHLYNQSGSKIAEMPCKGFHRGQLNAKLWL
jgi:hypothetical protein